jgi:hypothetical protein
MRRLARRLIWQVRTPENAMHRNNQRLLHEIVVVVVLKLALITALWWAFIRDHKVEVDVGRMAVHVTAGTQPGDDNNPDGETDGHRTTR